ncbi:ABC transporter ATP-binding protein [Nitrospiraceae bacterium HYJII51-Mn-bac16s-1-B09]|uniref:ABC transporter ATP-binding protein n=2 Tax=Candidatus Manganitrophus noduliformans TaxID=2606439 RepID=A0A7X6DN11_9BACT|nr:ABC transporter ATP-binding protein [Candidatus Manganitrophus noduliformans]
MALATFFLLLSSLISLGLPWIVRRQVDSILVDRQMVTLTLLLGLISLFLIQAFFSFGHNYLLGAVGQRVLAELRASLFSHLQTLSLSFFTRRRTGELLSRLTNDLAVIQTLSTEMPVNLTRQALTLIGGVAILLYMNWRLTFLVLLLIPIVVAIARWMGKRLKQFSISVQDHLADTTTLMEEMISGIRTIKSFGRESYEQIRFSRQIEKTLAVTLARLRISAAFGPVMIFLGFSAAAGILWYGAREILLGKITPGEIIAFIIYAMIITGPIGSFARLFSQLQEGLGSSQRVFEILDTKPLVTDAPNARPLPPIRGEVRFREVSFHYLADQPVLQEISFAVQPGEKVALIGPSGAGKSTLIHLLHRFYDPVSGSIEVDGRPLKEVTIKSYYDQIAFVPQEVILFGGTLRENILYGKPDATEAELLAASRAAHAHDFITAFPHGYQTQVGEKGLTLSGGQRQRIAIARAFLKNPRLLILDEATAYLDNESELFVQEALERLMAGKTTFVIAHRLTTIQKADRILVLNKGCLAEQGTHPELIERRGLYYHLYTLKIVGAEASLPEQETS